MHERIAAPYVGDASQQILSDIQTKTDGSFILKLNGYPFHATRTDTPEVYAQVIGALAAGTESVPYVEPLPTREDEEQGERVWRDQQITRVSWLRDRHHDELELAVENTLTIEQFTELLAYMQALRGWPQSEVFPDTLQRPAAPTWIKDQVR